jgi:uncharacterized protein
VRQQIIQTAASQQGVTELPAGTNKNPYGAWGNLKWVKYLPDLLTESNVQAADYYVRQVIDNKNYKRIRLEFDAADVPAVLKGIVLGLEVKSPTLLRAMHEYAKQVYVLRK